MLKFLMNFPLKEASPRKLCQSFTVLGCGQSFIALISLGSTDIPNSLMIKPKNIFL